MNCVQMTTVCVCVSLRAGRGDTGVSRRTPHWHVVQCCLAVQGQISLQIRGGTRTVQEGNPVRIAVIMTDKYHN